MALLVSYCTELNRNRHYSFTILLLLFPQTKFLNGNQSDFCFTFYFLPFKKVQAALVIRGFAIRGFAICGFDYSRT
jgi:hypothetical protein